MTGVSGVGATDASVTRPRPEHYKCEARARAAGLSPPALARAFVYETAGLEICLAERLASLGRTQRPPKVDIDCVLDEADRAVATDGINAEGVFAAGGHHARPGVGADRRARDVGRGVANAAHHHVRLVGVGRAPGRKPCRATPPGKAAEVVILPLDDF